MSQNAPGSSVGPRTNQPTSSAFIQSTPTSIQFPSTSIGQFYSSTVILSSMLATDTEVTVSVSTGARRQYDITPSKLTIPSYKHPNPALPAGTTPQGVPVTVKVRIASLSSADIRAGGDRVGGGIRDYITVKGDYFEQRIPVFIHLKQPPSSPMSRASVVTSDPATSAMVEQLQKRVEALSAQNSSLQSTLAKQTGENEHLRSLLDAVEADRGRVRQLVDDEIRRERESFEERSSKVLVILKRRDDTIANLNSQVESLITEQANYKSNNDSIQQRLNEEIERLQERVIQLSKDGRAAEIRQLEMLQGGEGVDASEIRINDSQVEDEYRRKIDQQNEQIEVLLTEVNTLRVESSSSLMNDSEAVKKLASENEKLKYANTTLRDEKSVLQKAFNDQRLVMDNLKQSYQAQQRSSGHPHPLDTPASLVEFDQTSKICDLEVKNSQLTSNLAEKEHLLKTMSNKATNLEKIVSSSSEAQEAASKKLQIIQPVLKQTEIKYKKSQDVVKDLRDKVARLEDLNETARNTCTMTEARLQEALTQIDDLTSSSHKNSAANKQKLRKSPSKQSGVMAWWIHIANGAKSMKLKDHEHHSAAPLTETEANRNLVQQGSIISQLRQDLLKAEVVNRNTVDDMEERLKAANVRIATLEQSIRIKRDDGMTRLRELESSLRVVSGRSDLHSSLAASRQELASERVKEVHQRGELELHVALLEEERGRVKELRAKVENLQDEVNLAKTVKTLENIPGVDPIAVIEQFACVATEQEKTMNELKREVEKNREKSARRRRRRHGGDGGSGDSDDSDSGDSDASDESDYLPMGSNNPNLNAPHSVDGVEVERLNSQVVTLEATLKEYEDAIVSEKEKSLKQAVDAEQLLGEVREANRRQVGKLKRKLVTATSELKTVRSELSTLRSSQQEVDEYMRKMNFELEKTKQELDVQRKLVKVDNKFKGGDSGVSAPEVNTELSRLQSLMDERTSQCAVLMQTVESLQNSLGVMDDGDGDIGIDHSIDGDSLDSSAITGHNSRNMTLAHRNLAKRVIALTAELSSATAVASMMERRAEQMGLEIKQRNELCNYLEAKLAAFTEENEKHEMRARVVAEEHSRAMSTFNCETSNMSNDNGVLRRALHESELKVRDAEVETSALCADVVVLEEIVYNLRKKLKEETESKEYNTVGGPLITSPTSEEGKNNVDFEDQMRVVSVVEQFIDKLQQMRSSTTSRRTKSQDDQIFAWVTDVIVKTDEQNLKTASRARDLQTQLRKTLAERDIALLQSEEVKSKLSRVMKRVELVEDAMEERVKLNIVQTEDALALTDRRVVTLQNELVSMSEKDLYICAEHRTLTKQLENSQKEARLLRKETTFLKSELKQANHVARVKSSKEINEKVGDSEEKLKHWVEAELPQLVNGKASAGKEWNNYSKYDDEVDRAEQISGSLAQALATSKAVQHTLEAKLDVALGKFDAANGIIEELRRGLHEVMVVGGVGAEGDDGNEGSRGGGGESMARLWELYSPTGIQTSILSPGSGEPNPTFQNLMSEVDALRVQVKLAEGASGVANQEQSRLKAWLEEARGDAANAQEQLGKRTNAVRTELERRHAKEITAMQQHSSQQHAAQVHALGQLRSELLGKETSLQECKLRLQLFGDTGKDGVEAKDINTGEISFYPPIVHTNALQHERDFLLQKNDSLVEELKTCSAEKVGLENECERLVGEKASIKAETEHLSEELSIHRSALRALEESVSAAVVGEIGGNGEVSTETLGRSLASAKLAEAQAIQRLQIASQNEVRMRFKVEEAERSIRELKRITRGDGSGSGVTEGGAMHTPATDAAEEGMSPWISESMEKLRQRVSTQASAIAYLELRIAQLMGDIDKPGDSGIQNLRRELAECREGKMALESEVEELKQQMEVRGKLALTVLDENSTRIEGEAELTKMRREEERRSVEMEKMEIDVEMMQERTKEEEVMRMSIEEQLKVKEEEVVSMKELLRRMRSEQRKMFKEYKEQGEKLLELGGGKGKYFGDSGKIELGRLKEKPLFLAADKLFADLSSWAEKLGQGESGSEMVWEDVWELTQLASEVRELASVAENLPTNLMGGMEALKTKIGDLQVEVEQREERVVEIADNAVTEMSVEAIQKLRAQVMLLKKRAEEGELYRKELAAENDALRVGVGKHQEDIGSLRKEVIKSKVAGEEEISSLRKELVALKKSGWEQTQSLREKYGKTIKEMEDAAERQSATAVEEMQRLEVLLAEVEGEKRVRDAAFGVARVETASVLAGGLGGIEEGERANRLQGLLHKAAEEAEESARRLKEMEEELGRVAKVHDEQVAILRDQFGKYREAQGRLVAGLNSQLKGMKGGSPGKGGGTAAFSRTAARIRRDKKDSGEDKREEMEELMAALEGAEVQRNGLEVRMKRLKVEFKAKSEELETARKSAFEITSEPNQLVASSLVDQAILETRCEVLQTEMRGILSDLSAEKDVSANLRRELAAAVLQAATVRSEKATNQPKVQGVLRQLADYKRRSKMEISNLSTQLEKLRTSSRDSGDAGALKKKNDQYSSALQLAREDLSRKNKIVMNLRNSRAADEKAVAQWKAAVVEMEEKLGKAKSELGRKTSMIEELKRKVSKLEDGNENAGSVGNDGGGGREGGEEDKVRSLTLERTRIRQQVSLLRSKVQVQQEEIDRLSKEKGKVQGLEGKINLLKASIVRKDSLLSALKNQIDATEKEFLLYKKSADASYGALEKKNRALTEKVSQVGKREKEEKEEEAERIALLERKKVNLASELANIKGNMYQIMGDLYSANAKARGSPGVGARGKSPEKLDEEKLAAISDLLDLSTSEMQEIFETGRNNRSAEGGEGGIGDGGDEEEVVKYMTDLEEALDLSGEKSIDSESLLALGEKLKGEIVKARGEAELGIE